MSSIFHVLHEEYERLQEAVVLFSDKMNEIPKGYIRVLERNGKKYAYLNWRESNSVKSKYIAPIPSEKYEKALLQVRKRKDYELRIKNMKQEIRDIEKALRHGQKTK